MHYYMAAILKNQNEVIFSIGQVDMNQVVEMIKVRT